MPESAPLPALPTPRGVRQASMISASVMGIVLLLCVLRTVLNQGESRVNARCFLRPRGVLRDHVAVEARAELCRPHLGVEIDVIQPEALVEAVHPFEIVQQAPEEIAAHRGSFSSGALELGEIVA